jgi:hypothetical protein
MEHAIDEIEQFQFNSRFVKEGVVSRTIAQKLSQLGTDKSKLAFYFYDYWLRSSKWSWFLDN